MMINNISHNHAVYSNTQKINALQDNQYSTTDSRSAADNVQISDNGKQAASAWQALANKYDVTSITTQERVDMARDMKDNGLISNDSMMLMVMPQSMNDDMNTPSNFIEDLENSIAASKSSGLGSKQLEMRTKLLGMLQNMDQLRNG